MAAQDTPKPPVRWVNRRGRLVGLNEDGKAVAVQRKVIRPGKIYDWPYWEPRLVNAYSHGDKSWREIAAQLEPEGCPAFEQITRRLFANPVFADRCDSARKTRALLMEDEAISIARELEVGKSDSDDAAVARVKIETLKWGAKVNDRDRYGDSTKLTGEVGVRAVAVDTGIRREGDPGFVSGAAPLPEQSLGGAQAAINEGATRMSGGPPVEDEE